MRIPILQEIIIPDRHPQALVKQLKAHHLGQLPTYWVSDIPLADELLGFLDLMESCLREMHVDAHFPFPFYIVSTVIADHSFFPVIANVTLLPSHFQQKNKRPKAKEQVLAQKVEIMAQLLQALDLSERRDGLRMIGKKTRALYRHAKEHALLSDMLQKMMDNAHQEK